jgi:phytoene/squalene synthetase
MLYWHSLWHWKQARAARYGFCLLQLYDDIMDGDRVTDTTPDAVAARTIAEWNSGQFHHDTSLSRLGAALDAAFRTLPLLPADDPRHDVLMLLQAMHRDAQRVATRILLTHAELKTQLRTTFHHSVNLLLITSRMHTRAAQVPDLVEALGWCSVVRDLNEDLGKGLINVPAELVQRLEAAGAKLTASHLEIQSWLEQERLAAINHLQHSAVSLQTLTAEDPRAARLLGLFHRSIARYAKEKPRPRLPNEMEPAAPISLR